MQYLKNLFGSFYNPQVYQDFINSKTSMAVWHFLISMVLIGALHGVYLASVGLPMLREKAQQSVDQLMATYPKDLIINWDGEKLTTQPEEYHELRIDPSELALFDELPGRPAPNQSLLYLNQDLSPSEAAALLDEENLEGLIDQESLYYLDPESGSLQEIAIQEYLEASELTIDKDSLPVAEQYLDQGVEVMLRLARWFLPALLAIGLTIGHLIVSLVFATLLYLPARMGKLITRWRESWRFTLVLLVVVEILSRATFWLYPNLDFPVYSVAFWALSVFILLALNNQPKPQSKQAKRKS